jgi:tetratricopeptide (TPR) repeat protein
MTWRCMLLVLALLAEQPAQAAPAQSTNEAEQQARHSFELAEADFRAGRFAAALAEYQAGYDTVALPGFLINIAQCQRHLGNLKEARIAYRKFLMVAPDSHFVPEVRKLLVELDDLLSDSEKTHPSSVAKPSPAQAARLDSATSASRERPPLEKQVPSLVSVPTLPATGVETGTRWWLWGSIGAALVVATTVAMFARRDPGTSTVQAGSLGTLRR